MKIVEDLKYGIGKKLLLRSLRKSELNSSDFTNFFNTITDVIILFPNDDVLFQHAVDVGRYFQIHKKNVTLFLPEHKKNFIQNYSNFSFITFSDSDYGIYFLATNEFKEKIKTPKYDLLINLDRTECLFYTSVVQQINSQIKISLVENDFSDFYNLVINSKETNPENSFKNLLNSLQMF